MHFNTSWNRDVGLPVVARVSGSPVVNKINFRSAQCVAATWDATAPMASRMLIAATPVMPFEATEIENLV
jgi:hypothetical protein